MPSDEAIEHVKRLAQHVEEVQLGLIPADSPPDFIRADWDNARSDGLPGWIPDNWHPTPEAVQSANEAADEAFKHSK